MAPEWRHCRLHRTAEPTVYKGLRDFLNWRLLWVIKWELGVLLRRLKYKEIRCCKAFCGCHRLVSYPNLTKKGENYGSRKQEKNQYLYG